MVSLGKRLENRTWKLPPWCKNEWIGIHAGKVYDRAGANSIFMQFPHLSDLDRERLFDEELHAPSQIVATARFSGCVSSADQCAPHQRPWFTGPYAWVVEELVELSSPILIKGAQGLWTVPDAVKAEIDEQHGLPFR